MSAEIGVLATIMAMVFAMLVAIVGLSVAISGGLKVVAGNASLHNRLQLQRQLVMGHLLWLVVAVICLTYAFIQNDFSIAYVAAHSSRSLPWFYKCCAWWGGHEGSMLLWVVLLAAWMFAVVRSTPAEQTGFICQVAAVLALIAIGFEGFILMTSNPFLLNPGEALSDGRDLNPLLQDWGFLFHPPILYMGYVGFAVAFAFALVSLWSGEVDTIWAKWTRPWTLLSWCFLTLGITLGSWWSYRELGWGGWWFWDPVENASFMPWLAGTALIHSLVVTQKRGAFKAWTLLLALVAFSLSLLGTFLVRSGVLTSVHAFAVSPERGLYILIFLGTVVGGSLLLFACRANTVTQSVVCSPISRELMLFANNVLLAAMLATVLLGTLYPLVMDALGWGKLSVGAPYFNQWFTLLGLPMLLIMGAGPHALWQYTSMSDLWLRLRYPILITVIGMALCLWLLTLRGDYGFALLGIALGMWVFVATLAAGIRAWRRGVVIKGSFWGMMLAHLGVSLSVLGIAVSQGFGVERDLRLAPGQSVAVGAYHFRFDSTQEVTGANYQAVQGMFSVIDRKGRLLATLHPQQRLYGVTQLAMTDSDIHVSIWQDWYVTLGQPLPGGGWSVRIYVKPMVRWIWGGGLMMMLGGVMAISGYGRRRLSPSQREKLCYA